VGSGCARLPHGWMAGAAMNVVEWITDTTACGVCLRPTAPDEETVVCIDVNPDIGSCVVCARCFGAAPPPRLKSVQVAVVLTVLMVETHAAPNRLAKWGIS